MPEDLLQPMAIFSANLYLNSIISTWLLFVKKKEEEEENRKRQLHIFFFFFFVFCNRIDFDNEIKAFVVFLLIVVIVKF